MKCTAAKIVPKLLNFEQKQRRMDIAQELLNIVNDDPDFLKKDHNWWRIIMEASRRAKTEKSMSSSVKCEGFAHCFLGNCKGVEHHEFLRKGRTANKEYYLEVIRRLREAIR